MCERDSNDDILRGAELTRRRFSALGLGAGFAALLPPVAGAVEVAESEVEIRTPDGICDAHFVHPANPTAGVLVWPDIFGLRPAFRSMGKRLAEAGYAVLTVNPFYRSLKGAPPDRDAAFSVARTLNADTHFADAKAFVAWLDSQKAVDTRRKIGTTGYCMGGPIVMRTAAAVPERIGAACSFHGGGLTTNDANSPHLLIPKMKASFLIAIADNDDAREPESKDILRKAFDAAGLSAEIEVYKGANHGWVPPDSQAYHQEQAERAWQRKLALFAKALA
ncbi:MAG: dienelactone hydrolase family protein [Pseudomonadota bacterium]|jgi:carboxymethylenebutenolidase|nr:MAG: dienelactone hydrolase [Pseudomonadota bacterium]